MALLEARWLLGGEVALRRRGGSLGGEVALQEARWFAGDEVVLTRRDDPW